MVFCRKAGWLQPTIANPKDHRSPAHKVSLVTDFSRRRWGAYMPVCRHFCSLNSGRRNRVTYPSVV